jgi:hypothetical protein
VLCTHRCHTQEDWKCKLKVHSRAPSPPSFYQRTTEEAGSWEGGSWATSWSLLQTQPSWDACKFWIKPGRRPAFTDSRLVLGSEQNPCHSGQAAQWKGSILTEHTPRVNEDQADLPKEPAFPDRSPGKNQGTRLSSQSKFMLPRLPEKPQIVNTPGLDRSTHRCSLEEHTLNTP